MDGSAVARSASLGLLVRARWIRLAADTEHVCALAQALAVRRALGSPLTSGHDGGHGTTGVAGGTPSQAHGTTAAVALPSTLSRVHAPPLPLPAR